VARGDRERWDARYREAGAPGPPSAFLRSLDAELPRRGRALDVAGGSGRNALWLAYRGLDVTLVDVSPVALDKARAAAAGLGLATVALDLEADPLPAGPFDLIVCIDYLQRSLFAAFAAALAPDGVLVFSQATRRNLERHPHPSARFLLDEGELPRLVADLTILRCEEGWFADGAAEPRHEARLVAARIAYHQAAPSTRPRRP
jgi:SAM-dependent methyltransferase